MHPPVLIWVAASVLAVGQAGSTWRRLLGRRRHFDLVKVFLAVLGFYHNHLLWVIGIIALGRRPWGGLFCTGRKKWFVEYLQFHSCVFLGG